MDILSMIKLCISTVSYNIFMPQFNITYILFLLIVYFQYKKNTAFQETVYGQIKTSIGSLMSTSILAGLTAGILISMFMTLAGISFSQLGFVYLLPVALLLMLIEPRFLCFSYSGGLLSLISLIFGLNWIDVTGIMALVAILHLMEAVLIYFDGQRGAIPVFLKKRDGNVVGGFTMQRFWPIPLALIIFMGYGPISGDVIHTPDWWPIIHPYIDPSRIKEAIFTSMPVCAVLGYSDFTSSYYPGEKCKSSAYKLSIFSILLMLLSIVSSYIYIFKYIAALFAPIAHEYLIQREKKLEEEREPIFTPASDGIRVLDTLPKSPAETMGIRPGDTIISINNNRIVSEEHLDNFFREYVSYVWIEVKDLKNRIRTLEYRDYNNGIDSLGILSVPNDIGGVITVKERDSFIKRLYMRIFKK